MSRKLKSLSLLSALFVIAIGVSSAVAHADRSARSTIGNDGAIVNLSALGFVSPVLPAPNPAFDVTGIWKSNAGDTMELFQEKDEVNSIFVNPGWAHRLAGRYVSPTKIRMVVIRRTRSGGCEVTMDVDINVNSNTSLSGTGVASETGCGLTQGQTFPGTWTRIL